MGQNESDVCDKTMFGGSNVIKINVEILQKCKISSFIFCLFLVANATLPYASTPTTTRWRLLCTHPSLEKGAVMDFSMLICIKFNKKLRDKKRINQKMKKMQKVLDKRACLG